jgi:hypothetical protein
VNKEAYPAIEAEKLKWKELLKEACIKILFERTAHIENSMAEARESANGEEKSSAGDKYETSRAMGHLAQEMLSKQLEDARQEIELINRLNTSALNSSVSAGAVVICPGFIFYVSLGLGNIELHGHKVTLLSPKAPLANLLHHKKPGESFIFNSKSTQILDVF